MIRRILIILIALFVLMNAVSAVDSSNWTKASVGYENFSIPPQYENPYKHDFHLYQWNEDIDVFTVRYVNPRIMSLYGYFMDHYNMVKKVDIDGRDAVHFSTFDRYDETNNSKLWFSAGEEFYYIAWRGSEITPVIKQVVKSASDSKYTHDEFYQILNDEYKNYNLINSIESQRSDYPTSSDGHHSFVSFGSNGINFGVMS